MEGYFDVIKCERATLLPVTLPRISAPTAMVLR